MNEIQLEVHKDLIFITILFDIIILNCVAIVKKDRPVTIIDICADYTLCAKKGCVPVANLLYLTLSGDFLSE
jgi:hypothetical protein